MNIHVAFFRNLNLGRPNCPTKVQFEEAFGAAAAVSASSFLTNGTLVFTTGASSESKRVFNGACEILRSTCLSSCNEQLQRAVVSLSGLCSCSCSCCPEQWMLDPGLNKLAHAVLWAVHFPV